MILVKRRAFLAALGTTVPSTLAGCTFGRSVQAGTLVISNDQDREHVVSVTVSKTSDNDGDVPSRPQDAPAPTTAPLWERDYSFEVSAGRTTREPSLVNEPGAFFVDVSLETGETASTWLGLYPAGSDSQQVAEEHLFVSIYEDGRLTVSTPVDD